MTTERPRRYFKLNYGYFLMIVGILLLIIPIRVLFPIESVLPPSLQPNWLTDNQTYTIIMIISITILILAISAIIYGIHDIFIGLKEQDEYFAKEDFFQNFINKINTDKKFLFFSVYTFVWLGIWIFNTLSVKLGPLEMPLWFIRENTLQRKLPDVPITELPASSSYNFIGILMDLAIFLIFLYVIYVYIRHGIQKMEYVIDYFFHSKVFFILFIIIPALHLIGHLPFELYGRFGSFEAGLVSEPETGLGQSFLEGWLAFDKVTHFLSALLITIIIIPIIIQQGKYLVPQEYNNIREKIKASSQFIYITALAYLIFLGVMWEFSELLLNIIMFQFGVINIDHFNVEYNDALKDLVFDFLGSLTGIIITYFENKYN